MEEDVSLAWNNLLFCTKLSFQEYVYNGKDEVTSNKKYENDAEEDDEDEEEDEEIPGFGGADTSYEDDEDCYEDTCNEDAYPGVQNVGLIGKVARTLSYFNTGGRQERNHNKILLNVS